MVWFDGVVTKKVVPGYSFMLRLREIHITFLI